jgi:hypothetical protein
VQVQHQHRDTGGDTAARNMRRGGGLLHNQVSDAQHPQRRREGITAHRQKVELAAEQRGGEGVGFVEASCQARRRRVPIRCSDHSHAAAAPVTL